MRDESTVRMWVASYLVFGAPWKKNQEYLVGPDGTPFKAPPTEVSTPTETTKKLKTQKVGFTAPEIISPKISNGRT